MINEKGKNGVKKITRTLITSMLVLAMMLSMVMVASAEADENLVATVRIANNTAEDRKAVLIMALYDKNGAMIDVATNSVSLTDELQPLSASMFIEEEFEGDKVEAFLWTDLGAKKLIDDSILIYEN